MKSRDDEASNKYQDSLLAVGTSTATVCATAATGASAVAGVGGHRLARTLVGLSPLDSFAGLTCERRPARRRGCRRRRRSCSNKRLERPPCPVAVRHAPARAGAATSSRQAPPSRQSSLRWANQTVALSLKVNLVAPTARWSAHRWASLIISATGWHSSTRPIQAVFAFHKICPPPM